MKKPLPPAIKIKTPGAVKTEPTGKLTTVTNNLTQTSDPRLDMVKITHLQGVKQSKSYQSGDLSYAVELYVPNNPKAIKEGIARAELLVENALGDKLPQMSELLDHIAAKNQGR